MSSGKSICIVSGGDEIRSRAYVNQAIYAREWSLDYRLEIAAAENVEDVFFYKTAIVRRMVPLHDWILWVDDDVYITDFTRDGVRDLVDRAEAADKFMVFSENPLEPNGSWSGINAGVFMLKNDPRTYRFLDAIVEKNLAAADEWWDEKKHGTRSGGDQDIQLWALHTLGLWLFRLERGHTVTTLKSEEPVSEELLDKYSIRHRSPMTELEYRARFYRWHTVGFLKPYVKPTRDRYRALRARRR